MNDPTAVVEARDSLHHLVNNGFRPLLTALSQPQCYTSGGRLNATALARELGVSPTAANRMLAEARHTMGE